MNRCLNAIPLLTTSTIARHSTPNVISGWDNPQQTNYRINYLIVIQQTIAH